MALNVKVLIGSKMLVWGFLLVPFRFDKVFDRFQVHHATSLYISLLSDWSMFFFAEQS